MPPSAPALKFRTPDVRYTSTIPRATSAPSDPVAAPSSTKRNADWLHSAVASTVRTDGTHEKLRETARLQQVRARQVYCAIAAVADPT